MKRRRPFSWLASHLSREGRALLAAGSAAVLFGADLGRGQAHVLVLASLSLVLATLLFTRVYRLSDVRAELSAPYRVTVGGELGISVQLSNDGAKAHHRIRIEPPRLPADARYTTPPPEIEELLPGTRQSALLCVRFGTRGAHVLQPFRAAALLPLGLSQGRGVLTPRARVMVVPAVARVASLSALRRRHHEPRGVSRGSRTGDAAELLGVRPYRAGDPLRDLHARSWARHGAPMVREYQEQHSTRVAVVVDTDAGAASPAHLEAALSLAAGVVARLSSDDAVVSALMAGPHVVPLSAQRGTGALHQALDVLGEARDAGAFVSQRMLAELGPTLPLLSTVVLIALGWDSARQAFVAAIEARGAHCLVYVVAEHASRSPRLTTVPLTAIREGRELAL